MSRSNLVLILFYIQTLQNFGHSILLGNTLGNASKPRLSSAPDSALYFEEMEKNNDGLVGIACIHGVVGAADHHPDNLGQWFFLAALISALQKKWVITANNNHLCGTSRCLHDSQSAEQEASSDEGCMSLLRDTRLHLSMANCEISSASLPAFSTAPRLTFGLTITKYK